MRWNKRNKRFANGREGALDAAAAALAASTWTILGANEVMRRSLR